MIFGFPHPSLDFVVLEFNGEAYLGLELDFPAWLFNAHGASRRA